MSINKIANTTNLLVFFDKNNPINISMKIVPIMKSKVISIKVINQAPLRDREKLPRHKINHERQL